MGLAGMGGGPRGPLGRSHRPRVGTGRAFLSLEVVAAQSWQRQGRGSGGIVAAAGR